MRKWTDKQQPCDNAAGLTPLGTIAKQVQL
ncbi:gp31 [Burkholderia phage BcepB1A]|nr:gp31 [Burkholderia phage BcepB1A]AAY87911.1 gp31 [Burkholderia phage BcepB1A]